MLDDKTIIELYFQRNEQAIQAAMEAYGNYCQTVANTILEDPGDAEEAVADTWIQAWNTIPPQRPVHLRLYLGKITRNRALSIWRKKHAQSRGGGQVPLVLDELSDCLSTQSSPEELVSTKELAKSISAFLQTLPQRQRTMFLRRYFYLEDIHSIAALFGTREVNVRMTLSRLRQKLKDYLIQEGYLP